MPSTRRSWPTSRGPRLTPSTTRPRCRPNARPAARAGEQADRPGQRDRQPWGEVRARPQSGRGTRRDPRARELAPGGGPGPCVRRGYGRARYGPTAHDRSVTLSLKKHLVAKGQVNSDFGACESGVQVKIQRNKNGNWNTIATDTTGNDGSYKDQIGDKRARIAPWCRSSRLTPPIRVARTSRRSSDTRTSCIPHRR